MAHLCYALHMARPAWSLKTAPPHQRRAYRAAIAAVGLGRRQWETLAAARDTGIPLTQMCRDAGIPIRSAYRNLPARRSTEDTP
jgi:hypothetical protein